MGFETFMSDFSDDRQHQRLIFIELCAYVLGYVNRNLLMTRFSVKQVTASNDIKTYLQLTNNLIYDHGLNAYKPYPWFSPYFDHELKEALLLLAESKQEIICKNIAINPSYIFKLPTNQPKLECVVAALRALSKPSVVEIEYISKSSGRSTRLIVPHSLIQMDTFTYIRAYDRNKMQFLTFKLNRIVSSTLVQLPIGDMENQFYDAEWQEEVELTIVPNGENTEAIAYDYRLLDGQLKIRLKSEVVKYFLMGWNIAPIEYPSLPSELFPLKVIQETKI